jgi:sugar phosphate isomerase/epimerase
MPFKFAVLSTTLDADPRIAANAAQRLGFDGIQLPHRTPQLDLADLSASGRREIIALFRGHRLEIASLRIDLGKHGLGPAADLDATLDSLQIVLKTAADLSCRLVCIDLGPLPAPAADAPSKPAIDPAHIGLIILPESSAPPVATAPARPFDAVFAASVDSALAELGLRADRFGVMLAFRSELAGFDALDRALRAAGCPWFGIDLDPVSILRDDWPAEEIFSRLGGSIRHVRARDAIRGADHRTKSAVIGDGSTDWPALGRMLDDSGFTGWIALDTLELPDRQRATQAGLRFLKTNLG